MRTTFSLLAASAVLLAPALLHAKDWSVGCATGGCVAVASDGSIAFIDLEKQTVSGVDKLTDAPKAPFVVSCGSGDKCVVVDGEGKMFFGPAKPGTPYKISKDKMP
jgi:hypothetical protein